MTIYKQKSKIIILPMFLAISLAAPTANAAPVLLGIGSLSGTESDLLGLTGTLESGVSVNLLGGMGSGFAYASNNTFLALPDRGPSYCQKWCSEILSSCILIYCCCLDTINKFDSCNDFGEVVKSPLPPPLVLRTFGQLEHHVQHAVAGQTAF